MGVLRLAFVSALVLEALATLGTAVVAVEVGLRLLYARVAFREALFVLVLAPEFYRPLRALGAAFHAGMAGKEAAARIARGAGGGRAARRARGRGGAARAAPRPGATTARRGAPRDRASRTCASPTTPGRAPALDGFSLALPAGRHRRPGGPERGRQDDGRAPPPALPRARRGRDHRGRRAARRARARGVAPPRGLGAAAAAPLPRHRPRQPRSSPAPAPRPRSSSEAAARARLDARPPRAAARLGDAGRRGRRAALRGPGPAGRPRPRVPEGRARPRARRADRAARPRERGRGRGGDRRACAGDGRCCSSPTG